MSRLSRRRSISGCYHIILRGVDRQVLFFDDADRRRFLQTIARCRDGSDLTIAAYCLMDNHVHILLRSSDPPGLFVKKVASSYVRYFNQKYDRVGHLFQDRFQSEPVDTDESYLRVFRYILRNPVKAGIGEADQYPWNSWSELDKAKICNVDLAASIAGGLSSLKTFVLMDNNDNYLEPDGRHIITDTEAADRIRMILSRNGLSVKTPFEIAAFPIQVRNTLLKEMKTEGLSVRQLSRLTTINRNVIQRI